MPAGSTSTRPGFNRLFTLSECTDFRLDENNESTRSKNTSNFFEEQGVVSDLLGRRKEGGFRRLIRSPRLVYVVIG